MNSRPENLEQMLKIENSKPVILIKIKAIHILKVLFKSAHKLIQYFFQYLKKNLTLTSNINTLTFKLIHQY